MEEKAAQRLRFGIMCGGTVFPAWQALCLEELLRLDHVEPALLIIERSVPRPKSTPWQKVAKLLKGNISLWDIYEHYILRHPSAATRPVDMADRLRHVPAMQCQVVTRGKFSQYFHEKDIAEIREYHLDFILRFAFGIICGEILSVPRYGIWSFHHDDLDRYRGAPPGFWELYHGDPLTGAVLQRLTDRLDGGIVLHRGYFGTIRESYVANCDSVHLGSTSWPARICREIRLGNTAHLEAAPSPTTAPVYHNPNNYQTIMFFCKVARSRIKGKFDWYFRNEQWNVGVVNKPVSAFLLPHQDLEVAWFPKQERCLFRADPFGVLVGGRPTVLVENYDYRTGKGVIAALECGDGVPPKPLCVAMDLPYHLSYPYLLEWEGGVYCVPESRKARQVNLYRATEFPRKWDKVATLIDGIEAVDPTIIHHGGRWWLFCTCAPDYGANLHAWHAESLLGPWQPHALNPLKSDIRSSRPAGTPFVHDGMLIRPAQDCSLGYGTRVVLNRVLRLTPTDFDEETVATIGPAIDRAYGRGIHTISALGNRTLVDGKRVVFIPALFWARVRTTLTAPWSRTHGQSC